jgi:putative transcriptional regulator
MKKTTRKSDGARIIEALTDLVETLEKGEPLERRFTVRTAQLAPQPTKYPPRRVRATRDLLGTSQTVFASLLGVSTALVQHWEQGFRQPSLMACRLLDEINRDPKRWAQMIRARKTA